jgi:hypothetical protein
VNPRFIGPASLAFSLLLTWASLQPCAGQELIANGGFENGSTGWGIYIPEESQDKTCRFDVASDSPHSGVNCARLQTDDFARFCIGSTTSFPVQPGERYRVSAWVRLDPAAHVRVKAPGFAIRLNLSLGNQDTAGGHLLIEPGNLVARNIAAEAVTDLPKKWTKVEAVVEVPAGVDTIRPTLFAWWIKGSLFVDDFSITKVDATTPVTPMTQTAAAQSGAATAPSNQPPEVIPTTGPVTSDADLLAALNLDSPGMEKVKAAAQAVPTDWNAVQSAYLDYRRTASPARWKVMPGDKPAQPIEKDDALGDEVIAHHLRNGYGFTPAAADMGTDFNWTFNPVPRTDPGYSDEWTYCNVSRMEFWQSLASAYWKTGDEKYATEWVAQLRDFAVKNPMHYYPVAGTPSLWRTLDSAERISISWPNAYYHFLMSPSLTPDANWLYLKLNYEHAELLLHGLSDPKRTGNWVATECGALYTIGALFPEFRDAASWRQTALDRISRELDRVVPPDGFEAELTPTYHFVALTGYRQPLEMARLNHLTVPDTFRTRIMQMYRAPVLVMDQTGHAVPTNDSVVVDIAHKAAEGLELGDDPLLTWAATHGRMGVAPPDSDALPYAGFYAMRGGWKRDDTFLFFRAGPIGIGHDHESSLEIVLRAWNKSLLFEPGTYQYDQSEWRRFTINTPSHSTIIVDDKWQHAGKNVPPVSEPTGNPWVTTPLFDYVAGTYSAGYQANIYRSRPFYPETWKGKADKSISHTRRVLFLRPYYALVLDTLDGTGTHTFDALFQMDAPAARLDPATHAAFSQNLSGAQLALYPLEPENLVADIVQGQMKPMLGWMPEGHRAIPTIRFRKKQAAPAVFATFLYPYQNAAPTFTTTPLAVQGDGVWARSLKTARESADVALTTGGAATSMAFTSTIAGTVQAVAAGLVIRQPEAMKTSVGAWNLTVYSDAKTELTSAAPVSLVLVNRGDHLLLFNAGDADAALTVKRPFAQSFTLPAQVWTSVSAKDASPVAAPTLYPPMEKASSGMAYDEYLKKFDADPAGPPPLALRVSADSMTLPDKAVKTTKTGSTGNVLARWDNAGSVASAQVNVPKTGWYRLKLRYCSGDEPLRSVLVNGTSPFSECADFSLPSTIGNPPSDGWSNSNDDWHEIVLGADEVSAGWTFHLDKGPCELALRNEGGGVNLEWMELEAAW